jgi:hypothetical protein
LVFVNVSTPAPVLSSWPLETTPEKVTAESICAVRFEPPRSRSPEKVSAPFLTALPRMMSPVIERALAKERAVVPSLERTPPVIVRRPVPKAEMLAA